MGRKRCTNCKELEKYSHRKDCIGICKKYSLVVRDTLSGCAIKKENNYVQ